MDNISLSKFLSEGESCQLFHKNDLQLMSSLQQYLHDPSREPLLFLGENILQCTIKSDHTNDQSTDTLHLYIREHDLNSNTKPHKFTRELLSVSGFDLELKACSKDVVLIQVATEPKRGLYDMSTLLLHLGKDHNRIELVHDVPEIAAAYGSPQGDQIFYTDKLRPALIHVIDIKTCQQKIMQISSLKEWPSKLSVNPSDESSNELACILSSNRDIMAHTPTGRLVLYNVLKESIVMEETSICFSSEILKYSQDGRVIIVSSKLPCVMHFLDSASLQQLQCFVYDDFIPFVGLPFYFPEKIDYLQDAEVLDMIPASKVVSNSRGLRGLRLTEGEMYFLHPMVAMDCKTVAVVMLNIGDTREESKVHFKSV